MKFRLPKRKRLERTILFLFFSIFVFSFAVSLVTHAATPPGIEKALLHIPTNANIPVCGVPTPGDARCHARVVVDKDNKPFAGTTPPSTSMGPVQFHSAYNLPCTPGGAPQSVCQQPIAFGPQTIAIVDAYHMPTMEQDLQVYSNQYGLPSCTKANGCLKVVNQTGGTTLPSIVSSGWAFETAMDVEVAHALCQTCKILLVEANSSSMNDLAAAVNTAANLGATAISNSYGANEWSTESAWDSYYNHPNIAVTASSGDNGYGTSYPAASKYVVAVGGTSLQLFSDNSYASESVWNGAGSGCSTYEGANTWQTSLSNWSQTNCGTKRAIADVSADADPNTGAAVYDSTPYSGQSGWWQVGGTSLSSPIIAATYALAGGLASTSNASSILYKNFTSTNSHDVVTGTNGNCQTILCKGSTGFDGPTGLGTPNGITGFLEAATTPTITPTSGPTLTPSPTVVPTVTPTPTGVDTVAPTVNFTFPTNGNTVPRRTTLAVTADASDNIAVTRVRFYRNGSLMCSRSTAPYTCSMYTASGIGNTVTYKATANDAAGNTSTTSINVITQ